MYLKLKGSCLDITEKYRDVDEYYIDIERRIVLIFRRFLQIMKRELLGLFKCEGKLYRYRKKNCVIFEGKLFIYGKIILQDCMGLKQGCIDIK